MALAADDIAVLEGALNWLRAGQQVALATVLRTWGSSPRPPGSLLAMNDQGRFIGSVSGGCVEEALATRYRDGEIAGPTPTLIDFGVERQEANRMGLPCGGRLELLVEALHKNEVAEILDRLTCGELVARVVDVQSGITRLQPGEGGSELKLFDDKVIKTFGPDWQLLLIGDGQLARHLASMALQLDYRVTICDPREEFINPSPLDGVRYTREMPDEAVGSLKDLPRIAVIALTHDPRQDDMGLAAALSSEAFYIGALGSRRSAKARRERLASLGHSPEELDRIHGPVGLDLGSKRPAEIALSILAHITAVRNGLEHQSAS